MRYILTQLLHRQILTFKCQFLHLQHISLLFEVIALLVYALDSPLLGRDEIIQSHGHFLEKGAP